MVRVRRRLLGALGIAIAASLGVRRGAAQGWEPNVDDSPPPVSPPAPAPPSPSGTASSSPPAGEPSAAEASSGVHLELGGVLSYVTPPIRGGANPFGVGLGGRAGIRWSGVYVGIDIVDFLGETDVDITYAAMLYGLDVGYGFSVPAWPGANWVLRPQLTLGDAAVSFSNPNSGADVVTSASGSAGSDTITVNSLFVAPALRLQLESPAVFVAFEGSILVLPGIAYGGAEATTWISYGSTLELGVRF